MMQTGGALNANERTTELPSRREQQKKAEDAAQSVKLHEEFEDNLRKQAQNKELLRLLLDE